MQQYVAFASEAKQRHIPTLEMLKNFRPSAQVDKQWQSNHLQPHQEGQSHLGDLQECRRNEQSLNVIKIAR